MSAPTVSTDVKMTWAGYESMMRQWHSKLDETIADKYYTTRQGAYENKPLPKPGEIRAENSVIGTGVYKKVWCNGACKFVWCLNRTGATLNQFDLVSRPVPVTGQAATGGSVSTIEDTGLTAHELVHTLIQITTAAAGGNAAPENEAAYVVKNTTTKVYLQPDFSVAIANLDQYAIYFPNNIEAAAAGDEASEVMGIVVAPDGIADNTWGWVCFEGMVWGQTGSALSQDKAIIAGTGVIEPSSTSVINLLIGWSPVALSTAEASGLIELKCGPAARRGCVSA